MRFSLCPGQPRAPRAHRHLEPQAVAWHHRQSELRVVHAPQERSGDRAVAARLRQQDRRNLRERFDHQDARHQRRARKVTLEEFFANRDVLVGDDSRPGSCSAIASTSAEG
jgi:hypothetical protein